MHFDPLVSRRRRQDPLFLLRRRIADFDVEHEAIELRFGKRVGAFLLDRILGGDGEERLGEVERLTANGHLPFLHRLQQGGLRFGWRAVDFVRQQDVGEDGALDEAELPFPLFIFVQHVGARDIGRHQIGGELHALETDVKNPGERADHQGLRQPGDTFQQAVSARENRREQLFHHVLLADNHLLQFELHQLPIMDEFLEQIAQAARLACRHVMSCPL